MAQRLGERRLLRRGGKGANAGLRAIKGVTAALLRGHKDDWLGDRMRIKF